MKTSVQWAIDRVKEATRVVENRYDNMLRIISPKGSLARGIQYEREHTLSEYQQMLDDFEGLLHDTDYNACPVCGELLRHVSYGQNGFEDDCPACKLYTIHEEYGNTEVCIGPFQTGWSYSSTDSDKIKAWVYKLGRIIREVK